MPEEAAFTPSDEKNIVAQIFVSYCHDDNKHLDGGILKLIDDLKDEYAFEQGQNKQLQVFTDVESIHWGDEWKQTINANVNKANILIPFLSPQYVTSKNCRKEFLDFYAKDDKCNNKILSIKLQDFEHLLLPSDPINVITKKIQWVAFDFDEIDERQYKVQIRNLAKKLSDVINSFSEQSSASSHVNYAENESDLMGKASNVMKQFPKMSQALPTLKRDFELLLKHIQGYPRPSDDANPIQLEFWAERLQKITEGDVASLNSSVANTSESWNQIFDLLEDFVGFSQRHPDRVPPVMVEGFNEFLNNIQNTWIPSEEIKQLGITLEGYGEVSKVLRPLADSFNKWVNVLETIGDTAGILSDKLLNPKDHLIDPYEESLDSVRPKLINDDDLQVGKAKYRCEIWRSADGNEYAIVRQGDTTSLINNREGINSALNERDFNAIKIEYWPKNSIPWENKAVFASPGYPARRLTRSQMLDMGLPVIKTIQM